MSDLKRVFRPELLNRIDEIIVFPKLTKEEIIQIVDLLLQRVREQMTTHEVTIELTEEAKELLVDKGYDPAMGARPLRRAIQRYIEDPLADFVLGRELAPARPSSSRARTTSDEEVSITLAGGRKREKGRRARRAGRRRTRRRACRRARRVVPRTQGCGRGCRARHHRPRQDLRAPGGSEATHRVRAGPLRALPIVVVDDSARAARTRASGDRDLRP